MFVYSMVSSPSDHSKRFTFQPPGRPVHSDFSGKYLGMLQLLRETIHSQMSTTVYNQVLIYAAE